MRLLIGGSSSKFFHLKEFGEAIKRQGSEYELVHDVEVVDGFPSRKISNWFSNKNKFKKLVQEFKPDAVFVDRQTHFGVAALESNLPLLVHLRGDYWSEIQWAKETLYKDPIKRNVLWWKNRIAEKCFKDSTCILPICNYLKNKVTEKFPKKSIKTLYQGIDPDKWYSESGMEFKRPTIGLLQSAIIWGKTREMLTLKDVIKKFPEIDFVWVGDGPYKNSVLESLNKFQNFKWLGHLQYPDKVRQYLSAIDVYALISGIDMSPLTLQEAQLMGKPVIATNVGGIPELMKDNETGFLVERGDYQTINEKISILINDEKKRKEMGERGRKFVTENFSWDKIAKEFLEISKNIL